MNQDVFKRVLLDTPELAFEIALQDLPAYIKSIQEVEMWEYHNNNGSNSWWPLYNFLVEYGYTYVVKAPSYEWIKKTT